MQVPFLEPVQPYASKAIDWISPRPYVLYGALLIPSCFILVAISALFSTKGQVGLSALPAAPHAALQLQQLSFCHTAGGLKPALGPSRRYSDPGSQQHPTVLSC